MVDLLGALVCIPCSAYEPKGSWELKSLRVEAEGTLRRRTHLGGGWGRLLAEYKESLVAEGGLENSLRPSTGVVTLESNSLGPCGFGTLSMLGRQAWGKREGMMWEVRRAVG